MFTEWKKHIAKSICIPQRYIVGIMGFLAIVNAYTMRITLSVAITEMVPLRTVTNRTDSPDACFGALANKSQTITNPDLLYDWSETEQGLILSSFYWGYVLTHIPGGLLAEKYGGKHALGLGILCTSLFTFITPWVISGSKGKWEWLVFLRVLVGLGEGTTFPALNVILARWVPLEERSRLGSLVFAGSQIGTVVGNLLSGYLIAVTKDWATVFYTFGVIAFIWVILWDLLCYNSPETHPFISDKEKQFLAEAIPKVSTKKRAIPWRKIFTSLPLWALIAAQIGHDWGFYAMVTDLPKYMKDVLKFNVAQNGLWSSVPYIAMWLVSIAAGWFCDYLIKKSWLSVTLARKVFTTIASLGPAVFIVWAAYVGCDRMLAVYMFTIAMAFMGTFYCGMKVNVLDLAPNFAGTLMGLVNGIGSLTGIIVPYLIGALTENHSIKQWRLVFWITFGVFAVTNFVFVVFGSGELQEWNQVEDEEQQSEVTNKK